MKGVNVNYKSSKGDTAFHATAKNRHKSVTELLLQQPGVNVNSGDWMLDGIFKTLGLPVWLFMDLTGSFGFTLLPAL